MKQHPSVPAFLLVLLLTACGPDEGAMVASAEAEEDPEAALIARAASLDLGGTWVLPPGEAQVHHAAGFAKVLCSNVFLTGLDPAFAAEHTGGFSSPFDTRGVVTDTVVDAATQTVRLTLPDGTVRQAKRYGSQGCVASNPGEDSVRFVPSIVEPNVPDAATTPWPMGDVTEGESAPDVDAEKVAEAVAAAFEGDGLTAAFLVTHKGRIIGERYRDGIDMHTPLESWSMGKSLSATLLGRLIHEGDYDLWQSAPIPEWQSDGDPRQSIRIADILRMSSGLRFRAPQDPDFDGDVGYPDHLYVYTGPNAFQWAASKEQQWEPGTVGRYRNSDPVLTNYMVRLAVEGRGEDYHSFPQRALFDHLGISHFTAETDPEGNFLLQGYEFASARDWARLGNLYLQDGVWQGERLLPEGFTDFVSTLAPAWEADGRPIYGGLFWINGNGGMPIPEDAYYMAGAGGQSTIIIPSHELVVVRLGHYSGAGPGGQARNRALELLMEAVPESAPNWRDQITRFTEPS